MALLCKYSRLEKFYRVFLKRGVSLTMSKSVYLELDDVISFKEFVISMRKGSLHNQIRKQAMDHYGDFPDLGTITVCKSDCPGMSVIARVALKLN